MKKTYVIAVLIVIIIGSIIWYRFGNVSQVVTPTSTSTPTTITPPQNNPTPSESTGTKPSVPSKTSYAGYNTNSNAVYGFSVKYPKTATSDSNFRLFYNVGNAWRVNAVAPYQGTPVIAFTIHEENNDVPNNKKYPLFFTTQVRISVTKDTKNCYVKDAGYVDQKVTNVTINGTTWKRFDFEDAGMMKYLRGQSYRTIRGNTCYVMERILAGSIYRDETMTTKTSDPELEAHYAQTLSVVNSFTFTR